MSNEHSPTPWRVVRLASAHIGPAIMAESNDVVARVVYEGDTNATNTNAARIVDAVNACTGMDDPTTYIADLKAAYARLQDENSRLKAAFKECETDAGALAYVQPTEYALRRFDAINAVVHSAIGVMAVSLV